jgi:hypothetical protein
MNEKPAMVLGEGTTGKQKSLAPDGFNIDEAK